ncbi:MAG: hypothetical protein P8P69_10835, partial [Ilumatobacter sp.]|nr:hypothetical protein [Ilumatobacter sp.]
REVRAAAKAAMPVWTANATQARKEQELQSAVKNIIGDDDLKEIEAQWSLLRDKLLEHGTAPAGAPSVFLAAEVKEAHDTMAGLERSARAAHDHAVAAYGEESAKLKYSELPAGDDDAPPTMNANDGPGMALSLMRQLGMDLMRASLKKEQLRTELGHNKLKTPRRKAVLKRDKATIDRIDAARKEKKDLADRYKAAKPAVLDYLKSAPSPEIYAQIAAFDKAMLDLTAKESEDLVEAQGAAREEAAETAEGVANLVESITLADCSAAELYRSVSKLADAGVGAKSKSGTVGITLKIGIGGASAISLGQSLTVASKIDLQDDRRLRATTSVKIEGNVKAELAAVLSASAAASMTSGVTEVFRDAYEWATVMAFRLQSVKEAIDKIDSGAVGLPAKAEQLLGEDPAEFLAVYKLADAANPTRVISDETQGALDVSALGFALGASYASKQLKFEKDAPGGGKLVRSATQTTKVFKASPGSNIGFEATRTIIKNHANPDNDGHYWNLKVTLSGTAAASFAAATPAKDEALSGWEEKLCRDFGAAEPTPSEAGSGLAEKDLIDSSAAASKAGLDGDVAKAVSTYLGAEIAKFNLKVPASFDATLAVKTTKATSLEWNFVQTGAGRTGYALQYRRTSGSTGLSIAASAPVASSGFASASIDLGYDSSTSTMDSEKLGTETLTYFQTVFNGLAPRDARDKALGRGDANQWTTYLQSHKAESWVAFRKIGSGEGGAVAEIEEAIAAGDKRAAAVVARGQEPRSPTEQAEAAAISAAASAAASAAREVLSGADSVMGNVKKGDDVDDEKWNSMEGVLTKYFEKQAALSKLEEATKWTRSRQDSAAAN